MKYFIKLTWHCDLYLHFTNPQWITVTVLLRTILPHTILKGNLFLVATFKIKGSYERHQTKSSNN